MRKIICTILAAAAMGGASAQTVEQDWIIQGGSGAASGNTWLDTAHAGRGIDFIPAGVPQNNKGEAVVVVMEGVAATSKLQLLAADDGANLGSIAMTSTGDGTIDHYRIATSDDGYIFASGFNGTVQQYTMLGGAPVEVVANDNYPTVTMDTVSTDSNSRALEVTGSVAAGTAKIFVAKINTIVVFGNSIAAPSTFAYVGQISLAADFAAADISTIASTDATTVYTSVNSGSGTTSGVLKLTFAHTPTFSATKDGTVNGYNIFVKQGLAVNLGNTLVAVAEAGGGQDGFGIGSISPDGLTFSNITVGTGLDGDGDLVYDAGAFNLDATNATNDVAMDPVTGTVYGYSGDSSLAGSDGAVFRLRVQPATRVDAWSIY